MRQPEIWLFSESRGQDLSSDSRESSGLSNHQRIRTATCYSRNSARRVSHVPIIRWARHRAGRMRT